MAPRRARGRPKNNQENDGENQNPDIAQLVELVRQQTATITQQQLLLQQMQPPQPPPEGVTTFKTFQYVKPLECKRTQDPVEAHAWLKEIEKAFALRMLEIIRRWSMPLTLLKVNRTICGKQRKL